MRAALDEIVAEALATEAPVSAPPPIGAPTADPPASVAARGLSPREMEVLRQIAAGRSDQENAAALFLGRRTVQSHVSHVLAKLGVDNRAAATAYAVRHSLA